MKELNWIGVLLGISILIVPWLGMSKELFHFVYGLLYLMYSLIYAGYIITNGVSLPGSRYLGVNLSRGTVNTVMMSMVLSVTVYAAYGVQGWLMLMSAA